MYKAEVTIIRGDQWAQDFELVRPGFDFTGATILAHLRATPDGALIHDCAVTVDTGTPGVATGSVTIPGTVTASAPRRCVVEIEVSNVAWGPRTAARLFLTIDPDYTHN